MTRPTRSAAIHRPAPHPAAVLSVALAASLVAACTSSGSSTDDPTVTPSPTTSTVPTTPASGAPTSSLDRYYDQKLDWEDCDAGFECTELTVPIDYAKPNGHTMQVAVIRKQASGTHRGSLIINPGGPGASGVDYARNAAGQFGGVTSSFDLVSFDPRGVARSRPIRCVSSADLDDYIHGDPTPDDPGEHEDLVSSSKAFAEACFKENGNYLSHVGTIDAARDMDVLRAALGDPKLTFYGASYGTYLGAKYAQLFPKRIRAMVLDGALDPRQPTSAENRVQAIGFETNLRDFLANCASMSSCPLGSSADEVEQNLNRLEASVDDNPLSVGSRSLGPGEFFEGLALGLYSTTYWPFLRDALDEAQNGDGARLLAFSDALTDRKADGSYGNLIESNLAINCVDRPSAREVSVYDRNADAFGKTAPHFGTAIAYGSLPCAFWRVPPVEDAHAVTAMGAPPIVVIGTTRDPATPYVWSKALAKQLSSGVLVTYDHNGHTAYDQGDSCIVLSVNLYLERVKVPRDGLRCP
jgi:pimeloyl-ACP methyl ester carboxylesterase